MFIILGAFYLTFVSIKVVYDARECSLPEPNSAACYAEVWRMAPGLLLAFMEATVMVAISVAISTRLGFLPNLVICFSIYVLGNLVPTLAKSAMGQMAIVPFLVRSLVGDLAGAGPFQHLRADFHRGPACRRAISAWPASIAWPTLPLAMFVALLMIEDRDLA